jgi:hypothetical protein
MKPNLFKFATSELSQDAFILWLLEWANPECATEDKSLHKTAQEFVRLLLNNKDLEITSIECKKQEHHIDVFAIVNEEYALIIEDKTNTSEHGNQLKRYSEWVKGKEQYSELDLHCIYYKTGNESYAKLKRLEENYTKEYPEENFSIITREDVLSVLKQSTTTNAIFCDYVEHLQKIQDLTDSYLSLPIKKWSWEAWQGFYMALEKELQTGDWGYVANPSGGFLGFWWHWNSIASNTDVDIYLQLEEKKLCVKSYQKGGVEKGYIYSSQLVELAKEKNISLVKPDRLRKGTTMTLAVHTLPDTANLPDIVQLLREIENFLDEASSYL